MAHLGYEIYAILQGLTPQRTRNLISNLAMVDYGDYWKIVFTATPRKDGGSYDYASAVNYGLNAKAQNRGMSAKEYRNYMIVERAVEQAVENIGGNVYYEIR